MGNERYGPFDRSPLLLTVAVKTLWLCRWLFRDEGGANPSVFKLGRGLGLGSTKTAPGIPDAEVSVFEGRLVSFPKKRRIQSHRDRQQPAELHSDRRCPSGRP